MHESHIHHWVPFRWQASGDLDAVAEAWYCACGKVDDPHADPVNKPHHYRWHPSGVECIDIASGFDYALGNVIKYVWRCDYKGKPIEDLLKAKTYLERAIADREAKSEGSVSDAL